MRSILLIFILAITFNIYAEPLGRKKCKTKTKELSCKIYKGKKEFTKGQKIGSGVIPLAMITFSAIMASKPKRTGE